MEELLMNNLLQDIQDKIGAEHCRPSCSKDKCKVDLDGTPSPHLIADPESKKDKSLAKETLENPLYRSPDLLKSLAVTGESESCVDPL